MRGASICAWVLAACGPIVETPEREAASSSAAPAEMSTSGNDSIVDDGTDASSGDVVPPPPLSECPFEDGIAVVDPNAPYPFCQFDAPTASVLFCAPDNGGYAFMNWHVRPDGSVTPCDDVHDCNACNCISTCRMDAPSPCPEPTSGTAVPTCWWSTPDTDIGVCFLACDESTVCPSGMVCARVPEEGLHVCTWITEGDRCALP